MCCALLFFLVPRGHETGLTKPRNTQYAPPRVFIRCALSSIAVPFLKAMFALKDLLSNNIPKERHKRAVEASGLKEGETLAGMAMDGIVLDPPPSVVKVEITT